MTFGGAGNDIINDRVEVHELFPTPLYVVTLSNIKDEYKDELQSIKRSSNIGNSISEDKQILNMKCFSRLKFEINRHLKNYYEIIEKPKDKIEPYITLSWINWTGDNQFHHEHAHQNIIISGVFYIDVEETDSIVFNKDTYKQILIETDNANCFNSRRYTLPIRKNDLVLFPSSLIHGVNDRLASDNDRISLSFNTFIRGTLGSKENATELTL